MAIFDTDINKLFTGDLALYKATRKNRKYWRERSEILEQALHDDVMRSYENVARGFSVAARELESSIADWYMRFAQSGSMSLTEARKLLSASELDELKWTVGEYIEYAKEHGADLRWIDKLERASAKAHISRLEALQLNAQNALEKAYTKELAYTDEAVKSAYRNAYYGESFLIQKGIGAGFDVARIDDDKLEKLVSTPWTVDKRTFSSRIWDRRDKVVAETQQQLTRACITGQNPVTLAKQMAKNMGVEERYAKRLLQTEGAYFAAAGEKASYQECGITDYEFVATLDSRTSEICREMDGRVFKVTQYDTGLNAPPMHVNCRSTTVAYFPEEEELAERIAKDDERGYYYIPADMKYKDWVKTFAEGGSKKELLKLGNDVTINMIDQELLMNYRHLIDDESITYKMDEDVVVSSRKIEHGLYDVRVSDKASVKSRRLHELIQMFDETVKSMGDLPGELPTFVVISDTELPERTMGRYVGTANTFFMKPIMDIEACQHCIRHEMFHWFDYQSAKSKGLLFPDDEAFIRYMCDKAKKKLDKLGINSVNAAGISDYAYMSYLKGRYDEVYVEYRVNRTGEN